MTKQKKLEYVVNYSKDKVIKALEASVNRYIKYVLFMGKEDIKLKTLIVKIDEMWNAEDFIKNIENIKEVNGLLFTCMEKFPRGDNPDSPLNRSRMIREFFENSFPAITADKDNIFSKLGILIQKILKFNDDNKNNSFTDLKNSLDTFINLTKKTNKSFNDLSIGYSYGGIHTNEGHVVFRNLIENIKKKKRKKVTNLMIKIKTKLI